MNRTTFLLPLLLLLMSLRTTAEIAPPEPGPEAGGLRLRLIVTPKPNDKGEGYDVRLDLLNVSPEAVSLRAKYCSARTKGDLKATLEETASIESFPPMEPWLGQVMMETESSKAQAEFEIKSGATVTLNWQSSARRLKNKVSNPLFVQNPDFTQDGLHAVHASVVLEIGGRTVFLRSNEQTVAVGGSQQLPKFTYGQLLDTDEKRKTATLGMGALQKVSVGDQFTVRTGTIGMTWTLTVTKVDVEYSTGTLEPSQTAPLPMFPVRGTYASLIPKKAESR